MQKTTPAYQFHVYKTHFFICFWCFLSRGSQYSATSCSTLSLYPPHSSLTSTEKTKTKTKNPISHDTHSKKKNSFFLIYKHDHCHFSPFIDHSPKNFVHEKKKKESISVLYRREKRGHATWVVASFFPFTYRNGIFFFPPYFAVLAMEGTD